MISADEQVRYWTNSAERDYTTMKVLLSSKRYPESLFFGHIILEKMLKAFYKTCTKEYAEEHVQKISKIYKDLCQKIKRKK